MAWDGISFQDFAPIIAGACGGLVRSISLRQTLRESIATITVGVLCSAYLSRPFAPILVHYASTFFPDVETASGPSGFIVGLIGIALTGFVMDVFKAWSKKFGKGP